MENSDYPNVAKGRGVIILKRNTVAKMWRLMRRGRARAGPNCSEHVTDSGTFIGANPVVTVSHPFKPFDGSTSDAVKIGLTSGVLYDAFFDLDWVPAGMDPVDGITIAVDPGDGFAWLEVTADPDTLEVTGVDLNAGTTPPDPTDTFGVKALCSYSATTDAIRFAELVMNSQNYFNANGSHVFWE